MNHSEILKSACLAMSVEFNDDQIDRLLQYHALLIKWNKAYNLTAVRDPDEMIHRHLVDSLSIVPHLRGKHLLDVGSGGGMPGVIIAVMQPDIEITLLDSNSKKTRFLNHVRMDMQLSNLQVEHVRLEDYKPVRKHDCITSRAFATLADMVEKSEYCCETGGYYLAMKGLNPVDEISELPTTVKVTAVTPLQVPGTDGERHLVTLQKL